MSPLLPIMNLPNLQMFVFCFSVCWKFALSNAFSIPTAVSVASGNISQTDTLHLLSLPIKVVKRKASRSKDFCLSNASNCNVEFESSHSYDIHCRHPISRGTLCSDESSKSEMTFTGRANLTTGILRQHSLANAKVGESFTLHILTDIDQISQIITIIIK